MKTCMDIPGGAIRSIQSVPEIFQYIAEELTYHPSLALDQYSAVSAGSITVTQNGLKQSLNHIKKNGLNSFFDCIDNQNKDGVKEIFPSKNCLHMLGVNPKMKGIRPSLRNAPYDNSVLPRIINDAFSTTDDDGNITIPKMGDFAVRTAFAVYAPNEEGKYGLKVITSYDNPETPAADTVGASSSYPVAFGAYDMKSEWLGQTPGKTLKILDGGIACPNTAMIGYEETEKIADKDEKITMFSLMMVDTKDINYKNLYSGGALRWLNPLTRSAMTRVAYNELYARPHNRLTHKANSKREGHLVDYHPIHIHITDADRAKYGVNFDSINSNPDNVDAFQALTFERVRTYEFRKSIEPVVRALDDRMQEKKREQGSAYQETLAEIAKKFSNNTEEDTAVIKMTPENVKPNGTERFVVGS